MHSSFGLSSLTELRDEHSRSITAENPDGAVGQGGRESSNLGQSRKGRPAITVESGETIDLVDVDGPGVIKHIWMTTAEETESNDYPLRNLVLRMYWDDEDSPSVEVPLGDFFCNGHGQRCTVDSMPIVVAPSGGFNTYFPMPFREHARVTIESDHPDDVTLFYQFDYSDVPSLDEDMAYFHSQWRRTNSTTRGEDHIILDGVEGEGHYVGTYLAWTALGEHWWGEGEVKFYLDGDEAFPTICGTGTEDYVGGAWCFWSPGSNTYADPQTYSTPFLGYPMYDDESGRPPRHGLYRWHVPDPVRFHEDIRVTVQDIGHDGSALFERTDDVASVAYWYQREPHAPFPDLPDRRDRQPR
jgi:hypothetical protein